MILRLTLALAALVLLAPAPAAAETCARLLFDARHPHRAFGVGTGRKRAGSMILPVHESDSDDQMPSLM